MEQDFSKEDWFVIDAALQKVTASIRKIEAEERAAKKGIEMGLTHTGTNRRYWEQRDKAREIVERLARDAEECGDYRLASISEEDVEILRAALKLPEAKKEQPE